MARTRARGGMVLLLITISVLFGALAPPTLGAVMAEDVAQEAGDDLASIQLQLRRSSTGVSVVPVDVVIIARRALEAELVIEAPAARVNWTIPVQLAANTEARETILLPVSFNEVNVVARLLADGEELAEQRIEQFQGFGPTNAVGLIGLDGPAEIDLAPDVGEASLIQLDDIELLAGLDSVVASPNGLRAFGADDRDRIWSWVVGGGQLVVAGEPGTIDDLAPTAWAGDGAVVVAGGGLIRYVDSTNWQNEVPPGVRVTNDADFIFGQFGGDLPASELLSDAGFRVPGLGVIAAVLGIYLVIAGPVTFGLLSARGRQTATWVVLPGLAVLFTLIVFGVGGVLTSGRGNGYATIAEVSPVGASITDTILIADSGEQRLDLPDGITLVSGRLNSFNGRGQGTPVVVEPRAGGDSLVFEIEPGSGGTAILVGHSDELAEAVTIIDLRFDGSVLSGTIVNATGEELEEAVVMIGSHLEALGALPGNSSTPFTVDLDGRARNPLPEMREWEIDQRFDGFDAFGNPRANDAVTDGPVNGSAWTDWRRRRGDTAVPTGMVTVVGWTRDLDLSPLGGNGRTAVVARAALPAGSSAIHHEAIREIAVTPFDFQAFEFGRAAAIVHQFIRPNGADVSEVALEVPDTVGDVAVWVDGEWRSIDLPNRGRVIVVPPAEAWQGDVLWVQSGGPGFIDPGIPQLELAARTDDATEPGLLPSGEQSDREDGFGGGPFEEPFFEEIELGRSEEVTLDDNDEFVADGEVFNSYDEWLIELEDGDVIEIEMTHLQNQLDPLLRVQGPDGRQVAENDDDPRGRGLNSYINFEVRETGLYVIEARPLTGGNNGPYELTIRVSREVA